MCIDTREANGFVEDAFSSVVVGSFSSLSSRPLLVGVVSGPIHITPKTFDEKRDTTKKDDDDKIGTTRLKQDTQKQHHTMMMMMEKRKREEEEEEKVMKVVVAPAECSRLNRDMSRYIYIDVSLSNRIFSKLS